MKLSTKSRYAITAVIDLANNIDDVEDMHENVSDIIRVHAQVDLSKQGEQVGEIATHAWNVIKS